jgi:hypothetical protein
MGRRSQRVEERFSQSDTGEAVDFEITFAALLATLSLTYPNPTHPIASQLAAFGLLAITLIRRMTLLSDSVENEEETRRQAVMRWTIPFVEFASVSVILLLFIRLYTIVQPTGVPETLFWVAAIFLILGIAFFQELLFRDELLWWYWKIVKRYENNPDSAFWLYLSARAWEFSQAPIADNGSGRFQGGPPTGQDDYSMRDAVRFLLKGTGLYLLGGGLLLGFGFFLLGWVGVVVVVAASTIRDQVRFWYAAYGNASFEQMTGPWYRTYLSVLVYLGFVLAIS